MAAKSLIQPLMWGSEQLPPSVYDAEVNQSEYRKLGNPTMGPAVLWAWHAFKVQAVCFIMIPILSYWSGGESCPTGGFAKIPSWVFVPACIAITYLLWVEEKVRKISIVPQVACCMKQTGYNLLGHPVPFNMWLNQARALSLLSHADVVTSGIFIAKVFISESCPSGQERVNVSSLWHNTMASSMFGSLSGIPFTFWAILGWLFIGFQFVYGAATSMPVNSSPDYTIATSTYNYKKRYLYDTWWVRNQGHHGATQALAETTRMTSVTSFEVRYMLALAESGGQTAELFFQNMQRAIIRFVIFGICESSYQLNLQSSGLAIGKALSSRQNVDRQVLASILLGVPMAFKTLHTSATSIFGYWNAVLSASDHAHTAGAEVRRPKHVCVKWARIYGAFFFVSAAMYVLLIVRAIFQTYMAWMVCPFGLHNIGTGCVDPFASI